MGGIRIAACKNGCRSRYWHIGITDHDSVNGIEEALNAAAAAAGAPVIAKGVELGTQVGESSVHILGYNIDIHNKNLLDKIEEMRHAREKRLHRMLDKIGALGYHITVEQCDPKTAPSADRMCQGTGKKRLFFFSGRSL